MPDKDNQSLDVLGIKPIGDAVNTVVKGSIDGAAAFLSRICLPAAEEFGLLLRDKVSNWRTQNVVKIVEKAKRKFNVNFIDEEKQAHPRLVSMLIEHGSWIETDDVQEMWAGLLVSSCTKEGKDDSNVIFMNLLSQMTTLQAKIINSACEKSEKGVVQYSGTVFAKHLWIHLDELKKIAESDDVHRLDREMDYLRCLELLPPRGGFQTYTLDGVSISIDDIDENQVYQTDDGVRVSVNEIFSVNITPTSLALNMYIRCQGSLLSPIEYFKL